MSRHHQGAAARHRNGRAAWLDNTDRICWLCLHPGADTVHDLIPAAHGGDQGDPANWVPAHRSCNASVGATIAARGCLAHRAARPANQVHAALGYPNRETRNNNSNFEIENSKLEIEKNFKNSNDFLKFEIRIHPALTLPDVRSAERSERSLGGRGGPPPPAGPCNAVHGAVMGDA